ncbi:MAG TPA: STAS domain-containing protein [Pseudonocardia sp.]|nr:STAS domain-containing protein [Pseudonocardia sp.]
MSVEFFTDSVIASISGEIDMLTVGRFTAVLVDLLDSGRPTLVVDLLDVGFLDCAGLTALLDVAKRAARRNVLLRVVPSAAVSDLSRLVGVAHLLDLE